MIEFVIFVLGIALFLYTVLGGADFGAGMVETIAGKRSIGTISKAIAPVWEANHVWLILVIVVVFNGFPKVYATLSYTLHIPLMVVLVGIIFRGAAFTFRHYDVLEDNTHRYYTFFFRTSSFLTPFFLGVTLGAMILGAITLDKSAGFHEVFIAPWFNPFCLSLGLFSTVLFSYIASIFLIEEVETASGRDTVVRYSKYALAGTVLTGILVMWTAQLANFQLFSLFIHNPISLFSAAIATLLIPILFQKISKKQELWIRPLLSAQVALILIGWAAIQFPDFIRLANGNTLTIYNTSAPNATFRQLVLALSLGVLLIIPAFWYLFKVFKFSDSKPLPDNQSQD